MQEIWKQINGYEERYQVSNLGRVKNTNYRNKGIESIVPQSIQASGYCQVGIKDINGKSKCPLVHRLVAEAFIPNPSKKPQVNHIIPDKMNNRADNLEWNSMEENMQHAKEMGITRRNPFNKPKEKKKRDIESFTKEEELLICRLRESWIKHTEIAKQFKTTIGTIKEILSKYELKMKKQERSYSEEGRKKQAEATSKTHKGKKKSEEQKQKMREAARRRWDSGEVSVRKGTKLNDEQKAKISKTHSKLSDKTVISLRERFGNVKRFDSNVLDVLNEIANQYDVSTVTLIRAIKRETYKHLN